MADVAVRRMDDRPEASTLKRKRSTPSPARDEPVSRRRRSRSPRASSPQTRGVHIDVPRVADADPIRRRERERALAVQQAERELQGDKSEEMKLVKKNDGHDAQAEFQKLLSSRSGGTYMPPARLRALQAAAAQDKSSAEYQRLSWDALRKSITGIVNRVNVTNIKHVIPELFAENLIRGRGLFCRSIMKAQAASLPFTPVFAAVTAIINTKLPQVGELLIYRLLSQFRRAFKRNDKAVCLSTTMFLGHLVNQQVVHDFIALQILYLLLERPTDDSVEIAVGFMREVGAFLADAAPRANNSVFERFRAVLHEGKIDKRVQYMIEVLFQVRKDKYKDNPILPEGLDLVEESEQITHEIMLDDDLPIQEGLNVFKFDPNYIENEDKYKEIKAEILGEDDSEEEGVSDEDEDEDEEAEEAVPDKEGIEDRTGTNLVNLRRVIYLTIMNALSYEEAVHKLMKVNIEEGQEIELCNMIIECCSQERSYSNFYGLIGERFSKLNRVWCESFEQAFQNYYDTIHRYETNRLRNIARFFGHLLATDSISWAVFSVVKMNEDDTTSSSRIFIKILLQEMSEALGLKKLAERFEDPTMQQYFQEMMPMDNPKNTRFSINYFTSIGLGIVTEKMREHLKNAPRLIMEQQRALMNEQQESSSSDTDSDDSEDDSEDDSDDDSEDSRSPPRRRGRDSPPPRERERRYSDDESMDDRSPPPRARRESPPPRNGRSGRYEDEDDRSPPRDSGRDYRDRDREYERDVDRRRDYDDRDRDRDRDRGYGRERSPPPRSRYSPPVKSEEALPRRRDDWGDDREPDPYRRSDLGRDREARSPPRRSDRDRDERDERGGPSRSRLPRREDDSPPARGSGRNGRRESDESMRSRTPEPPRRREDSRERDRDGGRDRYREKERDRERRRYSDDEDSEDDRRRSRR